MPLALLHHTLLLFAQYQPLGAPAQHGGPHTQVFFPFFGLGCMLCFALTGVLFFAFWLWMLIDCVTRKFPEGSNLQIVWILIIILLQILGALVYFFVGRNQGTRNAPPYQQRPADSP